MGTNGTEKGILALWKSVIEQAKRDYSWEPVEMTNKVLYRTRFNAKKAVEWWLGTADFYEVCRFADVNPQAVLEEFRRIRDDVPSNS